MFRMGKTKREKWIVDPFFRDDPRGAIGACTPAIAPKNRQRDKQKEKNRLKGIKKKQKRKAFTKTIICPEGVNPTQQERPITHDLETHCNQNKRGAKSQF